MRFFRHRRQAGPEIQDQLLQAVVSLYVYMAHTAKLRGEEINYIDLILRSMFGNHIPLYRIEQARQGVTSLREAANFLNMHLDATDRLKIILNLISLAYHDRSKIHVLGSLEIVELTDLLRLDVDSLEDIYALFEERQDSIGLPGVECRSGKGLLRNSMIWGGVDADIPYLGAGEDLYFIMVESLVLFHYTGRSGKTCILQRGNLEHLLEPDKFHCIRAEDTLLLPGTGKKMRVSLPDLWTVYNLGSSPWEIPLLYHNVAHGRIVHQHHRFWLQTKNLPRPMNRELALDEYPLPEYPQTLFEIITAEAKQAESQATDAEYYLSATRSGLEISNRAQGDDLLHFSMEAGSLKVEKTGDRNVYLNRIPLSDTAPFVLNQDIISIGNANFLINRHWELIEIPIQINELDVQDISHNFAEGNVALADISFRLSKSSMMAIMGPSGSGKTTLLQVLLGDIKAHNCKIRIDDQDYHANFSFYQKYIGYVPQDDLLFPNLTVYENLHYRIRLALPQLKNHAEIETRISNLLHSVGLFDQRHMIVGDVMNKKLSGGQRRRLNIALELILNPVIIILDEPTSGLSSKDSESIAEFLADLKEQNKIIICTIHQPSPTVFKYFDQVLLLDKGGREVFFGSTHEVFSYFEAELQQSGTHQPALSLKRDLQMPDYFYDLIETSDLAGQRRFPPEYWERKFREHSFRKALDIGHDHARKAETSAPALSHLVKHHHSLHNLRMLIYRNFINKSRSKINLVMTLLVSPLLALLTAFVLRGVPPGKAYCYLDNENSLLFGFISVIVFIFIGLANSIDDLLGEKRSIQREVKLSVSAYCQLLAKDAVLLGMTIIQVLLYYTVSSLILGMHGSLYPQGLFLLLSGIMGFGTGLFFSSFIRDRSAIINVLPLVIIPQIMFSGAVINFSDMNSSLRINRRSEIPEFCQIVPSRWLFEGWVVASARLNRIEQRKQQYLKTTFDTALSYQDYKAQVDSYNQFLELHPESAYENELIRTSVKLANGQYLNEGRNIFLSHRMNLFGKECSTLWVDILASLVIIMALGIATALRLKYAFR